MKQRFPAMGALIGMGLLILDGKTALIGARTGIELCLHTVIPALFPFLIFSSQLDSIPLLRSLGRLLGLGDGAEALLIPAFLGGYPLGARYVGQTCREGLLPRQEAERLLSWCSNAGPGFLFGMAGSIFQEKWAPWALWGIHAASALMTAGLFPRQIPPLPARKRPSLPQAMAESLKTMGLICGWVVLFRVVTAVLIRWVLWLFPTEIQVLLTGLLELTNGCCALGDISVFQVRFTLCSVMLAAGGVCVTMQTASVAAGLSLSYYFLGKACQILFSLLLCGCLFGGRVFLPIAAIVYRAMLAGRQKRGSILQRAGV